MTVRPKDEDLVRAWVLKADHDWLNIENNLAAREIPWDTVGFHAQQCAEKYLKVLLISRQIDPPKIHDLTELYALLPDGLLVDFDTRLLEELNPTRLKGDTLESGSRLNKQRHFELLRLRERFARRSAESYLQPALSDYTDQKRDFSGSRFCYGLFSPATLPLSLPLPTASRCGPRRRWRGVYRPRKR